MAFPQELLGLQPFTPYGEDTTPLPIAPMGPAEFPTTALPTDVGPESSQGPFGQLSPSLLGALFTLGQTLRGGDVAPAFGQAMQAIEALQLRRQELQVYERAQRERQQAQELLQQQRQEEARAAYIEGTFTQMRQDLRREGLTEAEHTAYILDRAGELEMSPARLRRRFPYIQSDDIAELRENLDRLAKQSPDAFAQPDDVRIMFKGQDLSLTEAQERAGRAYFVEPVGNTIKAADVPFTTAYRDFARAGVERWQENHPGQDVPAATIEQIVENAARRAEGLKQPSFLVGVGAPQAPLPVGMIALPDVPLEFRRQVEQLLAYRAPVSSYQLARSEYWMRAVDYANAIDPTFDLAQFDNRKAVRRDFLSGRSANNILALNTAVGHLQSLVGAADELKSTNFQDYNALVNFFARHLPLNEGLVTRQAALSGMRAKFNAVASELATIFKQTGATDQEIKAWRETVGDPTTATPKTWSAFVKGTLELMDSRLAALVNRYEQGMGKPPDFQILSAQSRRILQGLGYDPEQLSGERAAPMLPGPPEPGPEGFTPFSDIR